MRPKFRKLENTYRQLFPKRHPALKQFQLALRNKNGIEIGGPSSIFSSNGILPIYQYIAGLDGCNYSAETIWEGQIQPGSTYAFFPKKNPGRQFIAEGNQLKFINDGHYDFILSCHNLEHFANVFKTLFEWNRILKSGGHLVLVLPNRDKTFDCNRDYTTLEHLISDAENDVDESDTTHFDEILTKTNYIRLEPGWTPERFAKMISENSVHRCAHHHIFDHQLINQMLLKAGFDVVHLSDMYHNIVCLAKKINSGKI